MNRTLFLLVAMVVGAGLGREVAAADVRALPAGKLPNDVRLLDPKDLDGYFPFTPPASREAWAPRAEAVKRQILASQGLWPMPEKTPLRAVVHGLLDQGDYTVEKAYFESFPGCFVSGSLYRPKGKSGPYPAVLCPHGHWADGRFHDAGVPATRKQIVIGAERFENGGRSPLQARCVQLARMGCLVFHYDMIGYADCTQLSFELGHRFAKQRPEMNHPENWGFYSPQAEARLQSIMGLQTWNSVRALDFVSALPEVDPKRIAVTGASGGGTQTFLLAAVDPRIAVSFPAVMVSTAMQGGCTCENASCLRVGTGNIEFAALFAPKPQGMTGADDWTREMSTKGFPEIKQHYALMGAPDNVMLVPNYHFKHNYNYVSRAAMYSWLNKHFKLGLEEPIVEEDYPRLERAQLTVWDAEHPQPAGGDAFERQLTRHWHADAEAQLKKLTPTDAASLAKWREVIGGGMQAILHRELPAAADIDYQRVSEDDLGSYTQYTGLVRNKRASEELPGLFLLPKNWNKRVVIWIAEEGKSSLLQQNGKPTTEVERLLKAGTTVVGVDLFSQGEFLADGKPVTQNRKVKNEREFAGYTYGYNHALIAQRVHDVLTMISFAKHHPDKPERIDLVALDSTAPIAAIARALSGDAVHTAALQTSGFRFVAVDDYRDVRFLPGGAKYGDIPALIGLSAPQTTWVGGESDEALKLAAAAYRAAGEETKLVIAKEPAAAATQAAVTFLLK
ncbi:Acetyl xylan esterase (AXE1) [Anatilimnocola aggregata]|uniref:Acetyl xylan esterase (AXE1) n=1 Tax=Anatilimnocola aggregata TaxID=2528021 RepID=A0A517Y7X3_9BACT|nr:acetylxylan esterase [Anatilimnocola aggregata]QDU26301.1 Acetyl xylan esterase (AXE1) [Anatilimnocola aggregata]